MATCFEGLEAGSQHYGWTRTCLSIPHIAHVTYSDEPQPNITRLLGSDFQDHPRLYLEYVHGGSLENYDDFSATECASVLSQCLSALIYLHTRDPPLAHRDIKPDNILVSYRARDLGDFGDSGRIEVKLGDFGLSKDDNLMSICGSHKYLAPEVHKKQEYLNAGGRLKVTYTVAVDIWSLGVVAYEMMIGHLPQYDTKQQGVWCESIVNRLEEDISKRPDELKKFLLDGMVVLSPAQRWSAVGCYDQLLLVSGVGGVSSETPTLGNYAAVMHYREGRRQTNIWPVPTYTSPAQGHEDVVEDEPSTIRQCEYSHGGEAREPTISDGTFVCSTSIDRKKRVRADALLPGTHISKPGSSRKRHTSESPSSESPSRGRHGKRSHRQRAHKQGSSGKETERRSPFVVQESLNPQRTSQSKKIRGTATQVDRPSEAVHPGDLSERHQLSHTTTAGANVLDVATATDSATASLLPDDQLHNRQENRVIQQSCHGRSVDAQAWWSLPGLEEIEPASLLRNPPEDTHPEVQHDLYEE